MDTATLAQPSTLPFSAESSPPMSRELALIDLSSIAYPIYLMSASEPDPNHTSQRIVARVRALGSQHPHAAICCDAGRSFRCEIAPSYKANRPESEAALHHQITLAREQLIADGFPVWAVRGFEADDLIASATARALERDDLNVLIVSADKDLLQLVGPRVRAMSVRDGSVLDAEAVVTKFGVPPAQMRDYLTLVGDTSDNIKGAKGIGPKKAADLLTRFGSLDAVYVEIADDGGKAVGLQPVVVAALREFQPQLETTRALITLRADVDLPFHEITAERVAKETATFGMEDDDMEGPLTEEAPIANGQPPAGNGNAQAGGDERPQPQNLSALAVREVDVLAPAPSEWEKQLEPRSLKETITIAKYVFESRLFSAYGTPQAVLTTLLAGRELGLQSMASLRALHIIDGRPALAADLIRALVIRSGAAKYFRCTERTAERATFETQRYEDPPVSLTFTIAEARAAWLKDEKAWQNSAWCHNPADMCVARASSKLARLVYPDVTHGLYTPEEMYEVRDRVEAVA